MGLVRRLLYEGLSDAALKGGVPIQNSGNFGQLERNHYAYS